MKPLLLPAEAAAILRISPRLLRRLAAEGEVPCVRVGSRRRYRQEDLEEYIKNKTTVRPVPADEFFLRMAKRLFD